MPSERLKQLIDICPPPANPVGIVQPFGNWFQGDPAFMEEWFEFSKTYGSGSFLIHDGENPGGQDIRLLNAFSAMHAKCFISSKDDVKCLEEFCPHSELQLNGAVVKYLGLTTKVIVLLEDSTGGFVMQLQHDSSPKPYTIAVAHEYYDEPFVFHGDSIDFLIAMLNGTMDKSYFFEAEPDRHFVVFRSRDILSV